MRYTDPMSELDLVQLADNPDPRAPCLLLLDTSASMGGEPIQALNDGLRVFKQDLMTDELARRRVERGRYFRRRRCTRDPELRHRRPVAAA